MPPHPGDGYLSSALCSCGEWQFDANSQSDLFNEYRAILREHTAHARLAPPPPEQDAVAEVIGGEYEVHSLNDGHQHITDADGSIIGVRGTEWTDGYETAMRHCAKAALSAPPPPEPTESVVPHG